MFKKLALGIFIAAATILSLVFAYALFSRTPQKTYPDRPYKYKPLLISESGPFSSTKIPAARRAAGRLAPGWRRLASKPIGGRAAIPSLA
jgi:hypothetical protein